MKSDLISDADHTFMRRALALAERGWGCVAPNPLVGAVVVRDGEIIGEGFHSEYGKPHAEVEALRMAGERASGAMLYVTLEPCSHHGKTPPCTDAALEAGVRRVVFAASDPNPKAAGGAEVLRRSGVEVAGGVEAGAARDLNAPFFHRFRESGAARPWIELKLALSLDARIADRDGRSVWITGTEARAETHRLRAGCDAIAVGIGTVLADDPLLTVRGVVAPRRPPVRIVFDRDLRTPPSSRLVASTAEAPVWIVVGPAPPAGRAARLERAGVRILPADDLDAGLRALREEGIGSLFCEGGARLAAALLRNDHADRLNLFHAPLFLGPDALSPFASLASPPIEQAERWRHLRTQVFGSDTLITLAR